MTRCMRANGLTNFPDPGPTGFGSIAVSASGQLTVDGITFSAPAVRRAEAACRLGTPGAPGHSLRPTAAEQLARLHFSECMRAHGVPQFPDPGLSVRGQRLPRGVQKNSPAYRRALVACNRG